MFKMLSCLLLALLTALSGAGYGERFLASSDLHLTQDRALHASALGALGTAAGDFDGLILLGDTANNAHDAEHAYALEFLDGLGTAAYVIPGNHDLTARLRPGDFARLYGAYGWDGAFARDAETASCAVMTAGGTCLLLLDTNAYNGPDNVAALGGVSDGTLEWVAETLASIKEGTPVIACGHHPILPGSRESMTPGATRLAEALRSGGVRLYLCGHDHGFAAVEADGLQQITVGQPQAYPGWGGALEVTEAGIRWRVLPLYAGDDPAWREMAENAARLGERMGRSTLEGTVWEGDEEAVQWFATAFNLIFTSGLTEDICQKLLADPAAQKWREIETRTVVKRWIFGVLENCPQDVREIDLRNRHWSAGG